MSELTLSIAEESWPIRGGFRISRGTKTTAEVLTVSLYDGTCTGRGECVPYGRYGESMASVRAQINSVRIALEDGMGRHELLSALPAGAARNAVDCALWDLRAKQSGMSVAELAGLTEIGPLVTAYTLSLNDPASMADAAAQHADRPLIKLKLGGAEDVERVEAVRMAAPKARLIVDANEAWTPDMLIEFGPHMARLGVELIEQPLPADQDGALENIRCPVPLCADESCHDSATLDEVAPLYDFINIKLDKTGGLTEALHMEELARHLGLGVMVGCMLGTSLAMAPATLVAARARYVDLDGPLLLEQDRENGILFDGSILHPPKAQLWG